MNFLRFDATFPPGSQSVRLHGAEVPVPTVAEGVSGRMLALGVRPEHVRLSDDGPLRGEVLATEYLGTTQIVTIRLAVGEVKARAPALAQVRAGETVGLAFDTATLSLFDVGNGRAMSVDRASARAELRSAAHG